MTALASDRATAKSGFRPLIEELYLPVVASDIIYRGGMVAIDASGNAAPAAATASLDVIGVAIETVDNSDGGAGDEHVRVCRGVFKFGNSADSDAIAAADVGHDCYVVDDQTVAKTSNSGARPRAGRVIGVDTDGVWIELYKGSVDIADVNAAAAGDILYHNGTRFVRLAKGTAGQVLTMNAGATAPEWATPT